MALSSSLVKKFVDLTKDPEDTSGYYAYGTAIVDEDNKYVQLDGSDSVTSISLATDVATGDRVLIYIENHTATVVGNVTCPASGRTAIDVNADLLDFEELAVGYFQAIDAEIEYIAANYVETEYLTANYMLADYITANYILADTVRTTYATIDSLTAVEANITDLEAKMITVDYLETNYANIRDLDAVYASIADLAAQMITTDYLQANYATIEDLNVTNINLHTLYADYADITNLLAGNVGTGELSTIYLTAANVVIDDAVIDNILASNAIINQLVTGSINTDVITIYSDSGGYITQGATTQYYDADGNIRIQIGQDDSGNFTFILYDETGEGILIDQDGIKASAISDGLIVNDMVADDANISGYKLDISSVAERLTADGTLIVDAAQVLIDGETLDYKLTEIMDTVEHLEMDGVKQFWTYFARGTSPDVAPLDPDNIIPAYCGTALSGYSYCGVYDGSQVWTQTRPDDKEGWYIWVRYYVEYVDGHFEWSEPFRLTDGYIRETTKVMQTELSVIQGNISAIISQTQIDDLLEGGYTLYDLYASIDMDVDSITSTVESNVLRLENVEGDLTDATQTLTELGENVTIQYETMQSEIQQLSDSVTITISGYIQSIIETEEGMQNQLDEYAEYFRFTANGLEIGRLNSPFAALYSESQMSFTEAGEVVAYFSNSMLNVYDIEVLNSLRIGNFRFQPGTDGNFNLVRVGEY